MDWQQEGMMIENLTNAKRGFGTWIVEPHDTGRARLFGESKGTRERVVVVIDLESGGFEAFIGPNRRLTGSVPYIVGSESLEDYFKAIDRITSLADIQLVEIDDIEYDIDRDADEFIERLYRYTEGSLNYCGFSGYSNSVEAKDLKPVTQRIEEPPPKISSDGYEYREYTIGFVLPDDDSPNDINR